MITKDRKAALSLTSKVPASPGNMVNRPTVVPITGSNGATLPVQETDPYFAIKIDASASTSTDAYLEVILFDSSGGYTADKSWSLPANTTITGLTSNYTFMKDDIAHNAPYFDILKMTIDDSTLAAQQFALPLEVWESSKGGSPKVIRTFYPDMGIHEGQYHLNITTFRAHTVLTNRSAILLKIVPGSVVTLAFYQKAEIGRKQ